MNLSSRQRFIFYAICCYVIFGSSWIFLSDRLLLTFTDMSSLAHLSMAKGIAFILLTALLLLIALSRIPDRNIREERDMTGSRAFTGSSDRIPWWAAYIFAAAAPAAMLVVRMAIAVPFGERPLLIMFMIPVILCSLLGGFGPGMVATVVSAIGIDYYGIPPLGSLRIEAPHDFFQWSMLLGAGVLSSYLSELLHRARRQAEQRRKEQEKTQEELKRSEERFQLALQGSNDGLWDWNLSTGHLYLSPRWKTMLGYEEDELEPHLDSWKKLVHPEDRQRTLDLVEDLIAGRTGRLEVEFRLRHKDGRYLDILSRAFPARDSAGNIVRLVGTHIDMTERHKTAQLLHEQETLLEKTSRMARVGGWRFEVATGRGQWTSEVARIHDLDPGAETSVEIGLSFYHGEHRDKMERAVKRAVEDFQPYDLELELVSAKGVAKWVRSVGQPIVENGKVVRLEGIFMDISERKAAEAEILALNAELERRVQQRTAELTAANAELESFAYAVSHDMRAPLRAMGGFAQALVEDYGPKLEGEAKVFLDQIVIGSRRMGELIDGLLTLSRSTRSALQHDSVDISSLALKICGEIRKEDPDRRVKWHVESGLLACGDPLMLEVVMRNLLDNAWKYSSRQEEAEIRVFAATEGERKKFCVADNGAGFDEAHANKLFQPFQRLHRQDEFPGIGIGLATVLRIVHRHGGTLQAEGKPGGGATFCFSLPNY